MVSDKDRKIAPPDTAADDPMRSAIAASNVAFALGTRAFGLWLGAVATSMQAAHHLFGSAAREVEKKKGEVANTPLSKVSVAPVHTAASAVATKSSVPGAPAQASVSAKPSALTAQAQPAPAASSSSVLAFPIRAGKSAARVAVSRRPRAPISQKKLDDLKAISGIGPKLEQVLNGLGIRSYVDIAAMGAEQVGEIEGMLGFPGRIGRDDWIGQAAELAGRGPRRGKAS